MKKDFHFNLIKGKIAELIFQQMWTDAGKYTILPLGYERVLPGLLDWRNNPILKPIRTAPDFVLIPKDENDENILIVEVKFSSKISAKNNLETAREQNKRWNPSFLFYVTPDRFYFNRCEKIIESNGMMSDLLENYVSAKLQEKYLALLNKFLVKK